MEKGKIVNCVLAVGFAASLAGNVYLWSLRNSVSQQAAGCAAAIVRLEEELTQAKGEQDALKQKLEQTKTDLENTKQKLEQAKSDLETAKKELEKKAEEAKKVEDIKKAEEEQSKKNENNQNDQNPGNTGTGGGQQYTAEEIQRMLEEIGGKKLTEDDFGPGGDTSQLDRDKLPSINWYY